MPRIRFPLFLLTTTLLIGVSRFSFLTAGPTMAIPNPPQTILHIDSKEVITYKLVERAYADLWGKIKTTSFWMGLALLFAVVSFIGIGLPAIIHSAVEKLAKAPVEKALDSIQMERDNILRKAEELRLEAAAQKDIIRQLREDKDHLNGVLSQLKEQSESAKATLETVKRDADATAASVKKKLELEIDAGRTKYDELKILVSSLAKGQAALTHFETQMKRIDSELAKERQKLAKNAQILIVINYTGTQKNIAKKLEGFLVSQGYRVITFPSEDGSNRHSMILSRQDLSAQARSLKNEIAHITEIEEIESKLGPRPEDRLERLFDPDILIYLADEFLRHILKAAGKAKG